MGTPLRPPRSTGDPATDAAGAIEYLWAFYRSTITERFFARSDDLTGLATVEQLEALGLGTIATLEGAQDYYTPTAANDANLDALPTMYEAMYYRIGDLVTVAGRFTANATLTATTTSFTMTLPIASDFTALHDCAGTANSPTVAGQSVAIYADTTNNVAKVQWVSGGTGDIEHFFTFTYRIRE